MFSIAQTFKTKLFYSSFIEESSKKFIDAVRVSNLCHQSSAPLDIFEKKVTGVYLGFDPTADSLHIGHLPGILALARAANAGISSFALLGGSTALIGDPSFALTSRPMILESNILKNLKNITIQLENIFSKISTLNSPQILNNSTWLSQLELIPFLNDFGRHVKVSELLMKDWYFYFILKK